MIQQTGSRPGRRNVNSNYHKFTILGLASCSVFKTGYHYNVHQKPGLQCSLFWLSCPSTALWLPLQQDVVQPPVPDWIQFTWLTDWETDWERNHHIWILGISHLTHLDAGTLTSKFGENWIFDDIFRNPLFSIIISWKSDYLTQAAVCLILLVSTSRVLNSNPQCWRKTRAMQHYT